MKRKLSALLAIVLAVVMVFPTAIFVGAEELTLAAIEGKVSGHIDPDKTDGSIATTEAEIINEGSFNIPVDGTAIIKVTAPEGFTFDADTATGNVARFIKSGVASQSSTMAAGDTEGTVEIKGTKIGSDTIIFTATKPKKGSTPAVQITYRVVVNVVQPTIMTDDIVINLVRGEAMNGDNEVDMVAYQNMGLDPYDTLEVDSVDIPLNNGKFLEEVANVETRIAIYKNSKGYSFTDVKPDNMVSAYGGHDRIAVNFTVKNSPYGAYTMADAIFSVIVRAKEIEKISIKSAPNETFLPSDTLTNSNKERLSVRAIYTDGSDDALDYYLCGIFNVTDGDKAAAIKKAKDGKAPADSFEDFLVGEAIYIVVEYDNKYEAVKAIDVLDFSNPIPIDITIAPQSNAKKKYISGQTLGGEGWNGILITVKYADGVADKVYYNENGGKISGSTYPGISTMKGVLEIKPFVYGDDTVKFTYEENNTRLTRLFKLNDYGITVEKKIVERLEVANTSGVKVNYVEGEKLDLTGLTLNVYYNSGEKEEISYADPKIECSPNHRDALTKDIDDVLIVYTCVDEETDKEYSVRTVLPITVNSKPAEGTSLKSVKLLSSVTGKREYFIGEKFETEGYYLLIVMSNGDTAEIELSQNGISDFTVKSSCYDNSAKAFKSSFEGDLKVTVDIRGIVKGQSINVQDVEITIPGIKVTKRPVLQSIIADSVKDEYMVGDAPEVQEITITAKYDDNSTRVFKIADDASDIEKEKTSYSITTGGVTYTLKLTPNRIEEDTKAIRATYTEKISGGSTTTKYDDIEIEVIVPDAIMTYYDSGWKYEPFMDFDEALKEAEDYADTLSSSYTQSRKPSIQLCKDITVLYDYAITENMEIDLNGFDITMVPGEIFVKSTSSAEVTFVNNGKENSKIIYSKTNDDDNIIIGENDSYVIDANSGDGKYQITITKPTGGKVTGPEEVTHGHDVKFTITPDEDYEVKTVTVKEGKNTKKYENKDNVLTVKDVQGALTVTVTFQEKAWENPFTDVYKSATYYKSIQFVYENGLFSGMSATKFEPDTTMTRAMFVTVLGRLAGIDADEAANRYGNTSIFSDVSASDASIAYAVPYIKWATDNGLIEGYGNGKFGPKDNITHIQMYVLMQRYAAFIERLNTGATGTNIPANDVKDIPTWSGAYEAVEYAAKHKFLVTSSNRLTPNGNAKRSELAVLLEKFCTNVLEWED